MEENRRVILFALLATLSSVRGGDFSFSENALRAVLNFDYDNGVDFKFVKQVKFLDENVKQHWIEDPEWVREGTTKIKRFIPLNPPVMTTVIEGIENHGPYQERLSNMLMSFHVVRHKNAFGEDDETLYGKFVVCFNNICGNQLETCFYTFMFSPALDSWDKAFSDEVAVKLNPISEEQLSRIMQNDYFMWSLDSLLGILKQADRQAILKSPASSTPSNMAIHMQRGETAFFLNPIIVDEALLKDYYVFVLR